MRVRDPELSQTRPNCRLGITQRTQRCLLLTATMLVGIFGSTVRAAQRSHTPLLRLSSRGAHTQSRVLSALPSTLRFSTRSNASTRTQKSARGIATRVRFFTSTRLASQAPVSPSDVPVPPHTLSTPAVGGWLMLCSAMVFTVIVVGGITRLTESGLSITEWKPVTGVIPPRGAEEWEAEFAKYRETPEYKMYAPHLLMCFSY